MKKLLTLGIVLAISTGMTLAATSYTTALKNAIKQDIEASKQEAKNYNASVKEAAKKDMEAKVQAQKAAQIKATEAKRAEGVKELNSKITQLKKEKTKIQFAKDMTLTEKTVRINAIEKQIEYLNKQKNALK